jgi:hypothetical protein
MKTIAETPVITDEVRAQLHEALKAFKHHWSATATSGAAAS